VTKNAAESIKRRMDDAGSDGRDGHITITLRKDLANVTTPVGTAVLTTCGSNGRYGPESWCMFTTAGPSAHACFGEPPDPDERMRRQALLHSYLSASPPSPLAACKCGFKLTYMRQCCRVLQRGLVGQVPTANDHTRTTPKWRVSRSRGWWATAMVTVEFRLSSSRLEGRCG
jgi:hypothetical protein